VWGGRPKHARKGLTAAARACKKIQALCLSFFILDDIVEVIIVVVVVAVICFLYGSITVATTSVLSGKHGRGLERDADLHQPVSRCRHLSSTMWTSLRRAVPSHPILHRAGR